MGQTSKKHHVLLVCVPGWGHLRPLCAFGGKLAAARADIVVTVLVAPLMFQPVVAEMERQIQGVNREGIKKQIRVVCLLDSDDPNPFALMAPCAELYPVAYKTLLGAKPITCAKTKTTFEAVPPPAAVIIDFFTIPQFLSTKAISGSSVPTVAFLTGGVSTLYHINYGMEEYLRKVHAEAERTGKEPEDVSTKVWRSPTGALVEFPSLPPMYDYELFPQKCAFEVPIGPMLMGYNTFFQQCDAVIMSTPYVGEEAALAAMRDMCTKLGKPMYAVGPVLPPNYGCEVASSRDTEVASFLDSMLLAYGENSILYLSFGTIFWPSSNEYVEEVVEALLEAKFPFIFCHASPFVANFSEGLVERVKASGIGMLTTWSPQQLILSHKATGWFLTHGGAGSVTEALASGTPLICWPFDGDQPITASVLANTLKVAFELNEVKTGIVDKPLYATGRPPAGTREAVGVEIREVIAKCRGEEGKVLRRNAEEVKTVLGKAWETDGSAKVELGRFMEKYL